MGAAAAAGHCEDKWGSRGEVGAHLFYTRNYRAATATASTRPTRAPRHLDSHPEAGRQTDRDGRFLCSLAGSSALRNVYVT